MIARGLGNLILVVLSLARSRTFELNVLMNCYKIIPTVHSPEEVASGPRILCWVMFFHYLSLASLNGLVL